MGQQQCVVKGFGGVSAQFARDPVITLSHWPLYFYLPFMILMAVAATYHINVGLMNFGALEFVPVQVMCMMVLGTLTGLYFDQEYTILKTEGWILFTCGIAVIGAGLKVLSMKPGLDDDGESKEAEAPRMSDLRTARQFRTELQIRNKSAARNSAKRGSLGMFLSMVDSTPVFGPPPRTSFRRRTVPLTTLELVMLTAPRNSV